LVKREELAQGEDSNLKVVGLQMRNLLEWSLQRGPVAVWIRKGRESILVAAQRREFTEG